MNERKLTRGLDDIAPNNSDKEYRRISPNSKPEESKKFKAVVKTKAVQQKPSFLNKVKDSFFGEGGNVGDFVMYDILIPAFRNTISEMGFGIIEMFFGRGSGYGRGPSRFTRDQGRTYVAYNNRPEPRGRNQDFDARDRSRHNFGNVIYTSRGEAEDVLSSMVDIIEQYDEVTVAAFYQLSGIEESHVDHRYGWTNLRDAYTERVRNGYVIRLPQTRPL